MNTLFGPCFGCRLLEVVYERDGRCRFRCANRGEIPAVLVWREDLCPGFLPQTPPG